MVSERVNVYIITLAAMPLNIRIVKKVELVAVYFETRLMMPHTAIVAAYTLVRPGYGGLAVSAWKV